MPRRHLSESRPGLPLRSQCSTGTCCAPFPSDRRQPTLPVSLPLPRFTKYDTTLTPDPTQPQSDATQLYPLSPGSGSSTPCFDSDNSCVVMSDVVSVVSLDMLSAASRFSPLNPQGSLMSTEVVDRGVVESPVSDAAVVDSDMLPVTGCCRLVSFCCDVSKIRRGSAPSVAYFVTGVAFVACISCRSAVRSVMDSNVAGLPMALSRDSAASSGHVAVHHRPYSGPATYDTAADPAPGYDTCSN